MSEVIERPNGRTYRPRKAPRLNTFFDHEDRECLVVEFTHDVARIEEVAADRWQYATDCPFPEGRKVWWRLVPFAPNGSSYDRNWITDPARGTACVVFDHFECCP